MSEPLTELARFSFDWAPNLCDPAHGCDAYHRMWSLVRLIESDGALPAGAPFFTREIIAAARDGRASVLLSGAADSGVMALAVEGPSAAGLAVEVTALDRCRTPLEQARLYGAARGVPVRTIQCGLDTIPAGQEADAIIGHSILSFLPDTLRPAVFAGWAGALRPGGRVLLSQRLTPEGQSYRRTRPSEQVAKRRAELAARLDALGNCPVIAKKSEILDEAERFWAAQLAGNNVTESQINDLARDAGLVVRRIDTAPDAVSVSPYMLAHQAIKRPRCEIVLELPAV